MKSFEFYTSQKTAEQQGEGSSKGLNRADYIGMAVGFFVAWIIFQTTQFGILPATLIAYACYWGTKKLA
jgi:hypothetical protein